jgi:hypothetical protein
MYFESVKFLGLVRTSLYSFSLFICLLRLYFTYLVRPELEYASVIWNFITSANANKVERIQRKFRALCYNRLFPCARCSYPNASEYVKQHTLRERRNYLVAVTFADTCLI